METVQETMCTEFLHLARVEEENPSVLCPEARDSWSVRHLCALGLMTPFCQAIVTFPLRNNCILGFKFCLSCLLFLFSCPLLVGEPESSNSPVQSPSSDTGSFPLSNPTYPHSSLLSLFKAHGLILPSTKLQLMANLHGVS